MKRFAVPLVVSLVVGCGGPPKSDAVVPIDHLPPAVLKAARERSPGYTFHVAYRIKFEGKDAFEVRGKNKQGQNIEVEISPTGEVLAVE